MKLYDRIVQNGVFWDDSTGNQNRLDLISCIKAAIAIDGNSAKSFAIGQADRGSSFSDRAPYIVPPFPHTWVEFDGPVSEYEKHPFLAQFGVLFSTVDLWDIAKTDGANTQEEIAARSKEVLAALLVSHDSTMEADQEWLIRSDARWAIAYAVFGRHQGKNVAHGVVARGLALASPTGGIVLGKRSGESEVLSGISLVIPKWTDLTEDMIEAVVDVTRWYVDVSWTMIALTHCRNIELVERYPSRQEAREAKRRDIPAPAVFRTIQIDPNATMHSSQSHGPKPLRPTQSMHFVRGHIARYGDEFGRKKLFGKYEGQFFIPAHVRGSADIGLVDKDYKVLASKERTAA